MKLVKIGAVLFVMFFAFILYHYLGSVTTTQSYTEYDNTTRFNIDIQVENANITMLATNKDQIQIETESIKYREKISPVYYYFKDNVFYIKDSNLRNNFVKAQANITVFLPQNFLINDITIGGIDNSLSVDALTMNNLVVNGDNINMKANNSRLNDANIDGKDVNFSIINSSLNSVDQNIYSGTTIAKNSRITEDVTLNYEDNGSVELDNVSAHNITVDGNLKVNIIFNVTKNYKINIDSKIKTGTNVVSDGEGYIITGDSLNEEVTNIDFGDSTIDKFDYSIE